jgi:hypothetical protein
MTGAIFSERRAGAALAERAWTRGGSAARGLADHVGCGDV